MGDLTKNISRHELACSCGCGFNTIDWETIEVVQETCNAFAHQMGVDKVVLRITSAARCLYHNEKIGSNDRSQHVKGRAIDFVIDGIKPADVYAALCAAFPDKYGIGQYEGFTHVDTRSGAPARW